MLTQVAFDANHPSCLQPSWTCKTREIPSFEFLPWPGFEVSILMLPWRLYRMRQSTCHHDLECYHVCGDLWIEMLQNSVRLQADYSFLTSQSPLSFVKLWEVVSVCLMLECSLETQSLETMVERHPASFHACVCVCSKVSSWGIERQETVANNCSYS